MPEPDEGEDGEHRHGEVERAPEVTACPPDLGERERPPRQLLDDPEVEAEELEGGHEPEADPLATHQGSRDEGEHDDRHEGRGDGHVEKAEDLLEQHQTGLSPDEQREQQGDGGRHRVAEVPQTHSPVIVRVCAVPAYLLWG